MFRSWHDCTSTSSARCPLLFSSSIRYHNLGLSESACRHCAYLNPVPLLLTAALEVRRLPCSGFPQSSVEELSSTKFSLNSCSQFGNSCDISLCTSSDSPVLFLFSVSVGSCSGFPRSSSLVLPLLSGTGFSVDLLTSNTESCDEDDGEAGEGVVEEELAD